MTLIELIAVLAIIAVLAAALATSAVKTTDQAVATQETASLASFADAYQRSVLRSRRIPGAGNTDWATNVATEMGLNIANVTNNIRNYPRLYLIDTNSFPTNLPYVQGSLGMNLQTAPRVMLISSLGKALPSGLASGPLNPADFASTWNAAPKNWPTTGVWNGWTGNPNDITIQRINLSGLFSRLILSQYYSTWPPSYSIDSNTIAQVTSTPLTNNNFFFQGSVLSLYYTNMANTNNLQFILDSQQVLNSDNSFVFYGNEWRRAIGTNAVVGYLGGSAGTNQIGTNIVSGYDFSGLINGFVNANPASATVGTNLQYAVVSNFMSYMNDYSAWANSSFTNAGYYNTALASQGAMVSNIQYLINNIQIH